MAECVYNLSMGVEEEHRDRLAGQPALPQKSELQVPWETLSQRNKSD